MYTENQQEKECHDNIDKVKTKKLHTTIKQVYDSVRETHLTRICSPLATVSFLAFLIQLQSYLILLPFVMWGHCHKLSVPKCTKWTTYKHDKAFC